MMSGAPPKFVKDPFTNARKLNPAWKSWMDRQPKPPDDDENLIAAVSMTGGKKSGGWGARAATPSVSPDGTVRCVAPAMPNEATALPVVTSVQDQKQNLPDAVVAPEVPAAQAQLTKPSVAKIVSVPPEYMLNNLSVVFAKYQIPLGLIQQLLVVETYEVAEILVDDSGSMLHPTKTRTSSGRFLMRWESTFL
jgi:hypothetical protein